MVHAFVICPSTSIDILDTESSNQQINRILISLSASERDRPSTLASKRFRCYVAIPLHSKIIDVVVQKYLIDDESKNKKQFEMELEYVKTVLSAFEREGTMPEEMDSYHATVELARELDDEYDVYIVSDHEEKIIQALKDIQQEIIKKLKKKKIVFKIISVKDTVQLMIDKLKEQSNV